MDVNMLFLEPEEIGHPIPRADDRVRHVVKILKKGIGDELSAGTPDGRIGKARIESFDGRAMSFSFHPEAASPPLRPLELLLGLPRPIQANRILKDLCSLGVARITLVATELGEKSYLDSGFYAKGEYRRALIEGAQQAANPRLPEVELYGSLELALKAGRFSARCGQSWVLDPYRGSIRFGDICARIASSGRQAVGASPSSAADRPGLETGGDGGAVHLYCALAIGSERGWTDSELDSLERSGFQPVNLGDRILKSETASIVAASIALSALGYS